MIDFIFVKQRRSVLFRIWWPPRKGPRKVKDLRAHSDYGKFLSQQRRTQMQSADKRVLLRNMPKSGSCQEKTAFDHDAQK